MIIINFISFSGVDIVPWLDIVASREVIFEEMYVDSIPIQPFRKDGECIGSICDGVMNSYYLYPLQQFKNGQTETTVTVKFSGPVGVDRNHFIYYRINSEGYKVKFLMLIGIGINNQEASSRDHLL